MFKTILFTITFKILYIIYKMNNNVNNNVNNNINNIPKKVITPEELTIIRNYASNCGFPQCDTWQQVSFYQSDLLRKNSAKQRELPEHSSWSEINKFDDDYFTAYNKEFDPNYNIKKDIVPELAPRSFRINKYRRFC